ncbi:MAG: hypothetical protein JNK73_12060 [Bacteroidia bacterium]|nr:hypothetical protein [Bacteroidia bacterium]
MKNPAPHSTSVELLQELTRQVFQFGALSGTTKHHLLEQLKVYNSLKPSQIKEYRRCLLFIAAYPESASEYRAALDGLNRLSNNILHLGTKNRKALNQSGLPNTQMLGVYSFHLIHWLSKNTNIHLELSYFEQGAIHPLTALKEGLPEMEFELEGRADLKPMKWLELAFGSADRRILLQRLLQHIDALPINNLQKDQVFESMRVCVKLICADQSPVLKFSAKPFLHVEGLIKRFDEKALIQLPLPDAKILGSKQKKQLIHCARLSLLFLNRETDPVSLCDEAGLEYYELERGFSIAFFSARPDRRLPLESYIGFMMFKNGFPIAYGGAWLFGKRSLLGINIYESYRGGESAYLFAQLLRSYKQRFSPSYFEVEPYQFGKGNPEGIKTGAFWFYYRFGFRPVDKALRALAAIEFEKIQNNKTYRTPASTLKAFTSSNMMLRFEKDVINLDPSVLSTHITRSMVEQFQGNRVLFRTWALNRLKTELGIHYTHLGKTEKTGVEKLYPFVCCCLSLENMSSIEKETLRHLILEKGNSEFKYAEACEHFPFERYITPKELRISLGL